MSEAPFSITKIYRSALYRFTKNGVTENYPRKTKRIHGSADDFRNFNTTACV